MCFSVNVNLVKEELENRFGATLIDPDKYRPSYYYHAFSFPEMPAICSSDPGRLRLLKWGLIPSWTRSQEAAREIRSKTFNARSESIAEKSSFSGSFRSKRCIIPVRGFFEWQHAGKDKIPWYVYRSDNDILTLAGLFDEWTDNSTGELNSTFSIITTTANEMMAEIHNSAKRMPALLESDSFSRWLNPAAGADELKDLLKPSANDILKAHTIGPLVNNRNVDRNTPELILPYKWKTDNLLF
jgi:putative SOS response-associated peptidase YedK